MPTGPELVWIGDGERYVPGVPARDLTSTDIDRIVYRRTCGKRPDTTDGLRPGDPGFDEVRAELVASLLRDELYAAPAASGTED